ncbi:calcium-binding protein [Coralliovum pocilloporae]|uniref:calcium-binding protein n=1 Tax=Coralliovum pocilloporae TaxID=3066369 RepID=UPI0033075AEE
MNFATVLSRTTFEGYTNPADIATIKAAMQDIYETPTGKAMIDRFLSFPSNTISFEYEANQAAAFLNTGIVLYDVNFSRNFIYINKEGVAVQETVAGTIAHEFVHALDGLLDNWQGQFDHSGDTVTQANLIYKELGIDEQLSYVGGAFPNTLTVGRDYAMGQKIDRAWTVSTDYTSSGSARDLIIGNIGSNTFDGGAGNDIIYGGRDGDRLSGGDDHDRLFGEDGNDILEGDDGHDHLYGGDGSDDLRGGRGNDRLYGGDSNDQLDGGDDTDRLDGGRGADRLDGGAGNNDIAIYSGSSVGVTVNLTTTFGSGGDASGDRLFNIEHIAGSRHDDVLTGDGGRNYLYGNGGEDRLFGEGGDDILNANGPGADYLDGGSGIDTVRYYNSRSGVTVNLSDNSKNRGDAAGDVYVSIENVVGSRTGNDSLTGDSGANWLRGFGGNDSLRGAGGNDRLEGGDGKDRLEGGQGADQLNGGSGSSDLAIYSGSSTGVTVNLTNGTGSGGDAQGDTLSNIEWIAGSRHNDVLTGNSANNVLYGNGGEDRLFGEGGNDTLNANGSGADYLDGGSGIDTVRYYNSRSGVTVNLTDNSKNRGDAAGDVYVSIENVIGSRTGNDDLTGDSGANWLRGFGGNDSLRGAGGNDSVEGGDGKDRLEGGQGADRLDGGSGSNDLAVYSGSSTGVTVNLTNGTGSGGDAQGDILSNIEWIAGSRHNDVLTGNSANNVLYGNGGEDRLFGEGGNDTLNANGSGADYLDGGSGIDTVRYYNSRSGVTVNLSDNSKNLGDAAGDAYVSIENVIGSRTGNDDLTGDSGANWLRGFGGDDRLEGAGGNDRLEGGNGDDTFVFAPGFGQDVIDDFTAGAGSDDVIEFDGVAALSDFSEVLALASDDGTDTTITLDAGNSIVLKNTVVADLHDDDFRFV